VDTRRVRTLAAAVAAVIAATGCSRAPDVDAPLTVRDSAGVELIELGENLLDSLPEWSLDSGALAIGTLDGPPEYQLNHAATPWQLSDGWIVVANDQKEIRYYDRTGRHLLTVGSKGEGPGQYRQLWSLYPLPGDSVLAFDVLRRVTILAPRGDVARVYPYGPQASYPFFQWLPDRGAAFYDSDMWRMLSRARSADAVVQDTVLLLLADATGQVRDTLDRLPGDWVRIMGHTNWTGIAVSGGPLLATGPAQIVAAHGDVFALRWYDRLGALRAISRVWAARHPVTQSDIAREEAWERALYRRPIGVERGSPRDQRHAEYRPLITRLLIDRAGRAWVRRWAFDDDTVAPWVVFDSSGRPLARITMPGAFRPNDIGDDYVLGILRDPGSVDVVVRYQLRRSAARRPASQGAL
jgi:hypothetical protein